jgi:hypothetical protein
MIENPDGSYRWSPIMGRKYWLGYQHSKVIGIWLSDESVFATYFGFNDEGRDIFFREEDGKVLRYSCPVGTEVVWYSDGCDDPSVPAVPAQFDGLVPDGPEKDYIIRRMASARKN